MPEVTELIHKYLGHEKKFPPRLVPGARPQAPRRRQGRLLWRLKSSVESFRHNLSPVEVKILLTTVKDLTENLCILYCIKIPGPCPRCGQEEICQSSAVSLFSSSFDKITHEIKACLRCGWKDLSMLLMLEKM